MKTIRTPEDRFESLKDFPYKPNYLEIDGNRIHYIDEGKGDEVILALHGEPTWAYLYRKFIPVLAPKYRFICMDFLGFGKSDKPTKIRDYSYELHFETIIKFIDALKLKGITLVVQDWGGIAGLGVVGEHPELFKRLIIMNTALPDGERKMPMVFKLWKLYARWHPTLPIAKIVKMGSVRKEQFDEDVVRAYKAPFPSSKYKAGARAFPRLVPTSPDTPGVDRIKKAQKTLSQWNKPCLVMFSDKDPIMRPVRKYFYKLIPTAKDQNFFLIKNAGHFLQEDAGEEIAQNIDDFIEGKLQVQK